jgi:RNA recognition motif-containing protein
LVSYLCIALSLNGCQLDGSQRPLVVKYAEDQHKKKELNRLHNLTLNTSFQGGRGGGMGGMGGGPPMNGSMNMKPKNDMMGGGSPFYYQSQNMVNMYSSQQPPPMPLVHSPVNSNHQMFLPSPSNGSDYNKRGPNNKGKKGGFPYDSSSLPNPPPGGVGNWFPQQLPFLPGPPSGIPPPPALHPSQTDLTGISSPFGHPAHNLHGVPVSVMTQPPPGSANHQNGSVFASRSPRHPHQNGNFGPSPPGALAMPFPAVPNNPSQYQYSPGQGQVTISVANLPSTADNNMLHELFSSFGRIINAQIEDNMRGGAGGMNGNRFVRGRLQMANLVQAEAAVQALNGAVLFEGSIPLQVRAVANFVFLSVFFYIFLRFRSSNRILSSFFLLFHSSFPLYPLLSFAVSGRNL